MSDDRTLNIGRHRINLDAIKEQIEKDIVFLNDRIGRMKILKSANPVVLQTYNAMLANRQSVLEWLLQNNSEPAQHHKDLG